MKFINLFEDDRSKTPPPQFTGAHQDLYSTVINALKCALRAVNSRRATQFFKERFIGDTVNLSHPIDIAKRHSVSVRTVHYEIAKVIKELEREMIRRKLIDPAIIEEQKRFN
jgi:hypothetical protein